VKEGGKEGLSAFVADGVQRSAIVLVGGVGVSAGLQEGWREGGLDSFG